jgi:hypothetical protein
MSSMYLNNLAVLFCPVIDEQNNWETIVMNPMTEEVLKINKTGYFILKQIADSPGISKEALGKMQYLSFIELMIRENIIIEKSS